MGNSKIYQLQNIKWLNTLENDLEKILKNSGLRERFDTRTSDDMIFLSENKSNVISQRHSIFERLKDCPLCSYKVKLTKNIRILFYIYDNDGVEIFIFLHAFEEKRAKDYKLAIKTAMKRLNDLAN